MTNLEHLILVLVGILFLAVLAGFGAGIDSYHRRETWRTYVSVMAVLAAAYLLLRFMGWTLVIITDYVPIDNLPEDLRFICLLVTIGVVAIATVVGFATALITHQGLNNYKRKRIREKRQQQINAQ